MTGLLQFYFFPTDFYYPKPQPNTINTNAQPQQLSAMPAPAVPALQTQQKDQELGMAAFDDGDDQLNLENREKPISGSVSLGTEMMRDSCNKVILKATSRRRATASNHDDGLLIKPNRDLGRAVMFEEDYWLWV